LEVIKVNDHQERFCKQLADEFGGVEALLREHVTYYDQLLPTVFFGDLTRYLLADPPKRAEIVRYLEIAFLGREKDIEDLIAVSLVENIETGHDLERILGGVNGTNIRKEWERQHGLSP
jgi:hypothetical protein